MATSIRTLVLRVLGDSTRNIHHVLGSRVKHSFCNAGITVCRGYSDGKSTHFGFETVPEEDKAERVYKVFESVAKKYDVMNDAMSLGIHRLWKDTLLHIMNPQPGLRLLDTAGGTGDISFRFLEYTRSMYDRQQRQRARSNQSPSWQDLAGHYKTDEAAPPQSRAVVCDINKEMLKVGKQRAEKAGIVTGLSWVVGDAEELPFNDDQFDLYTIAFGIRNVTHIELYDTYSFQMIPVLGEVIAGDWKSYQYLVESIRKFPDQETFKEMIEGAGFFCVQYFNLTGGIVAIHSGFKL
ncbi:2-methoxy-6-polyprenyl-1,4-benzoquinol methylase, mitochondrial isoform X2 [Myxocyprinus asiaticus]|uniref:2-methoxy-6-polyprenyl-1,4-benzoquinol methylase, mitochondrial isoform X2 n=1 Tax=Myxocyprinus asiaticus TaxID=70543 RepID=UPI002222EAFA|nr:2-methoxy-6-polyprenyl-1,4-benzoquinol methylase, mitochondrial isoform X2 [Myxocyprinus asiaticus]